MTNDIKKDTLEDDTLEFSIAVDEAKPSIPKEKKNIQEIAKNAKTQSGSGNLKLQKVDYVSRATRGELYKELKKREEVLDKDLYEYANPFIRGIAFVIDYAVFAAVGFVCPLISPYEMICWDFFLNKYNLVLDFPREIALAGLTGLNLVMGIFLFAVMPVAFYNRTLGKKLTGLHVRGVDQYTITLASAFKRELFWKPISLGLLVGIVMPFFNKQKQSLHDRICGTIVTK